MLVIRHFLRKIGRNPAPSLVIACLAALLLTSNLTDIAPMRSIAQAQTTAPDASAGSAEMQAWQRGCQFAFFPSLNQAWIAADFSRQRVRLAHVAEQARKFHTVVVSIHAIDSRAADPMVSATLQLQSGIAQPVSLPLPSLQGACEARFVFQGATPELSRTVTVPFERRKYAWEGNTLGITDQVFAPFTPVRADDQGRINVVGRTIELDGSGLWRQITSLDTPLLAGPMNLRCKLSDGTQVTLTPGSLKLIARTHQATVYEGSASSPVARVRIRSTTEFDGMTRIDMTLSPGQTSATIERLWLEIPLRTAIAQLMHNLTDTNRIHHTGEVPKGEGVVWSSDKARRQAAWRNSFNAYLWLGQTERGVAWFAENDRDWLTERGGSNKPIQQIVRDGEVTRIEVSFINTPSQLTREHTLVFGIQASPTKPMEENWRARVPPPPAMPGPVNPWGGLTCSSKAPFEERWEVVDKIMEAKRSGRVDEQWFGDFAKRVNPPLIHGHINWLDRTLYHARQQAQAGVTRPALVYFEEMRAGTTHPEWQTFQDEWGPSRFTLRSWPSPEVFRRGMELSGDILSPTSFPRSYQDYALHLADEWLKRDVGLYWDNTYPQVSFNPVMTAAYVTEDGSIQPALVLWNQREYQKRVWNLLQHRRKTATLPLEWAVHMTSTLLLPLQTFATTQLDNEFVTTEPLRPDYIRAEATGLQVGNYSRMHYEIGGRENQRLKALSTPHRQRINWGMCRVHEIVNEFDPTEKIIRAFGYGDPSVQVTPYWTPNESSNRPSPITLDRSDVLWLHLHHPGRDESMLVLSSWNPQTLDATITLRPEVASKSRKFLDAETGRVLTESGAQATVKLTAPYGVAIVLMQRPGTEVPAYVPKFDPNAPPIAPEITVPAAPGAATISRGKLGQDDAAAPRLPTEKPDPASVLFADDFQSDQRPAWSALPSKVRIITDPEDNTGKNRIARFDAPQVTIVGPDDASLQTNWTNYALRFRFRVGPLTHDTSSAAANATFLTTHWRRGVNSEKRLESQIFFVQMWRSTQNWRFDGPRVTWFGRNEAFALDQVSVRPPQDGLRVKVDQSWQELEIRAFGARTQVRFNGQIIFDGKDDRVARGGFSITSSWDQRAVPTHVDIDDVIAWRLSGASQLEPPQVLPTSPVSQGQPWIAPLTQDPPAIDAKLDDGVWQQLRAIHPQGMRPWQTFSIAGRSPAPLKQPRRVWLAQDEQALYLAMEAEAPDPMLLAADSQRSVFMNDGMEVHLRRPGGPYLHLGVDCIGRAAPGNLNQDIDVSEVRAAAQILDNTWVAEMRVPWSVLGGASVGWSGLEMNLAANRAHQGERNWAAITATPALFNIRNGGPALLRVDAQRTAVARRVQEALKVDGRMDEATWAQAPVVGPWRTFAGQPVQRQRQVRLLYDDANLYVAMFCRADPSAVLADPQSPFQGDTLRVELTGHSMGIDVSGTSLPLLLPYQIPFKGNASKTKDGWGVEMALPWEHIGGRPVPNKPVLMNLSGHDTADGDVTWSPVKDHRDTKSFGHLLLVE